MKQIFTLVNILLVAAMAYLCVDMIYENNIPDNFRISDGRLPAALAKNIRPPKALDAPGDKQYDIIVARNLFHVEIEETKDASQRSEIKDEEPVKLEPTNLKLVLWGTVTGESDVYAVIEDKKVRQQSLYQVGDSVQGATVKKILRHEVILTFQGKDQVLEMEEDPKNMRRRGIGQSLKKSIPNVVSLKESLMDDSRNNMGAVMKQIKFRPHFTEGEADGLMVYGIRPNSIFRKIGLRNGDIIKDINGTAIVSADDASSLFTEVEDAEDARVTLFRRGKVKELVYQVDNNQSAAQATREAGSE